MAFKTQKDKLIDVLRPGAEKSTKQLASRLKISDSRVRYLVSDLRRDGYAIYSNRKDTLAGPTSAYRLGTPSRRMVAFAASIGGSSLFTRNRLF